MRLLETERLLLKPVEETDLPQLLELQWDKEVMQYMRFNPISMANQVNWYNNLGKTSRAFIMHLKSDRDSTFIGLATLNNIDPVNQRASWGMKMKPNLQGKGIGFEASLMIIHYALYYLNLNKIHADYLEENQGSDGLVKKIGLRQEGLQLNHMYHKGKFHNLVLVGMLKEEFYAKHTQKLAELGLL